MERDEKRAQLVQAGAWLRRERERRGFTTGQAFADALGIGQSLLSKYELGINEISDNRAEDIARVLKMDIIEVRRGLRLWVPDDEQEPAEPRRPEDMSIDELGGAINQMLAELKSRQEQAEQDDYRRTA